MDDFECGVFMRLDFLVNMNKFELSVYVNDLKRIVVFVVRLDNLGKGVLGVVV